MSSTTIVNLKGHLGDPGYEDVVYVGRPMRRGGRHLEGSPLASPFRPGRTAPVRRRSSSTARTSSDAPASSLSCPDCAGGGWGAGAPPCPATQR